MPPTELPGYYYDEIKKKYFKIQENHLAPPSSAYSRGAIERNAVLTLARKQKQDREQLEREQTIQHSKVLKHSSLGREIGCRKTGTGVRWDAWAKGLKRREALQVVVEVHYDMSQFIFDELTGSFVIAVGRRLM